MNADYQVYYDEPTGLWIGCADTPDGPMIIASGRSLIAVDAALTDRAVYLATYQD